MSRESLVDMPAGRRLLGEVSRIRCWRSKAGEERKLKGKGKRESEGKGRTQATAAREGQTGKGDGACGREGKVVLVPAPEVRLSLVEGRDFSRPSDTPSRSRPSNTQERLLVC